ncbi:MAG TPA: NADP-dependent oxidoreductase [Burkholderiaceae bacterium]|nr:NADP-dependent oxidoreductase [Burkholderiaceae bacterium]
MSGKNLQILLASRPQGEVGVENFRLVEAPIPAIGHGEVLVRNHFLSLDPYMRGRMDDAKSYAAAQPLDEVMIGGTAGEVIESRNPEFALGDRVIGMLGWQLYGKGDGRLVRKVDTSRVPLSAYLGAVGMPGVTAWYGLNRIVAPKAGETVVVSAASGAVGSVVGQLAKRKGCRVVGVAGGAQKCAIVVEEYGFDACVDYKAGQLYPDLRAATPGGIDGYFDNVGGATLDAVLRRMNAFGRIAVCGLISSYDGQPMPLQNFRSVLVNRLRVEGFIVSEHMELWPEALRELGALVGAGELKYRETIAQGLESAPQAFIGLLKGRNVGKQLVRLIAP